MPEQTLNKPKAHYLCRLGHLFTLSLEDASRFCEASSECGACDSNYVWTDFDKENDQIMGPPFRFREMGVHSATPRRYFVPEGCGRKLDWD